MFLALAMCTGVFVLAGCGWTPRDEYMLSRSTTHDAREGSGEALTLTRSDGSGVNLAARRQE